jgi:tetratricopeptide (TPR) repeat protein
MKNNILILIILFSVSLVAQEKDQKQLEREAREEMRKGNELYNEMKFSEAEISYKKALSKNPNYPKASYNLGNSIYQQNRNKEAVNQFELVEKTFKEEESKAEAYHNMGNAFLKEKQYQQAVEAYKNSLRNNSKDDETRYNLAVAQEMLKNEQNQNKNDQNNKDKKDDNKDNQNNKDQQNKDGGDDEKKDDKQDDKDKGKDKQDDKSDQKKNQDKKDEDQKKQPRPNQLTPEQMKQLLEAMNNEENKTQKKLNARKAKGKKIKQEKDW